MLLCSIPTCLDICNPTDRSAKPIKHVCSISKACSRKELLCSQWLMTRLLSFLLPHDAAISPLGRGETAVVSHLALSYRPCSYPAAVQKDWRELCFAYLSFLLETCPSRKTWLNCLSCHKDWCWWKAEAVSTVAISQARALIIMSAILFLKAPVSLYVKLWKRRTGCSLVSINSRSSYH